MSLTLGDLVAMPELKLKLRTSGPDVDRVITWVHVSELVDPTPFLTGGELLLTTGLASTPAPPGPPATGHPGTSNGCGRPGSSASGSVPG